MMDKLVFPCTGQALASRLEDLRQITNDVETNVSKGLSDLSLGASQVGDLLYTFRNKDAVGVKYLLCNGSSFDETEYPELHTVLGGTNTPTLSSEEGYYIYIRALPSSSTGGVSNE